MKDKSEYVGQLGGLITRRTIRDGNSLLLAFASIALAFAGGALVRGFKSAKKNPIVLAFAAAVVAYMAQAVVNIAVPITTPLFIIFVSLCEAMARKSRENNKKFP